MVLSLDLRGLIHTCVKAVFREAARQLISNESRVVYTLSSAAKLDEINRVSTSMSDKPVRVCIIAKDGAIQLVFVVPSTNDFPRYLPPKPLMRAIRDTIRQNMSLLTEEQRRAMLSLTMRVQGLRSTDGSVMTEGVIFKPNADSVTLVCRFGANRPLDVCQITRVFEEYSADGCFNVSKVADEETAHGISAEGKVCSDAGLTPLVLYAQLAHSALRDPGSIASKRAKHVEDHRPRKRGGFLSVLGL